MIVTDKRDVKHKEILTNIYSSRQRKTGKNIAIQCQKYDCSIVQVRPSIATGAQRRKSPEMLFYKIKRLLYYYSTRAEKKSAVPLLFITLLFSSLLPDALSHFYSPGLTANDPDSLRNQRWYSFRSAQFNEIILPSMEHFCQVKEVES